MGNDKIQFRGETEKAAAHLVDEMRVGGINISELAREGLREKLRESLSDEEKIRLHHQYKRGEISEGIAEVLLGNGLDEIDREQEAFEAAKDLDTDSG